MAAAFRPEQAPLRVTTPRQPNDSVERRAPLPAGQLRMHVRQATIRDLDNIVALRLALVREHASNPVYKRIRDDADLRARELYSAQLKSDHEAIFVAERGLSVIGVIRVVESAGSVLLDPPRYGYVSSVYVQPECRRRGVLKAMLEKAERWCLRRGIDEMRLHSASDNPTSNATWDALGFEIVEHVRLRSLKKPGA